VSDGGLAIAGTALRSRQTDIFYSLQLDFFYYSFIYVFVHIGFFAAPISRKKV
jgi:hypothetical protein